MLEKSEDIRLFYDLHMVKKVSKGSWWPMSKVLVFVG